MLFCIRNKREAV